MIKVYLILFLLFFVSFHSIAQETKIEKNINNSIFTGKIIDINGIPIIGAKISVKGTTKETSTNFDGKFSLEIEEETILHINFIGFQTIEALVKPQTNVVFHLEGYNSNEAATYVTRKEMRRIRQANKKPTTSDGGNLIESLFYNLKAIAE